MNFKWKNIQYSITSPPEIEALSNQLDAPLDIEGLPMEPKMW
jgi:hypothetical protein